MTVRQLVMAVQQLRPAAVHTFQMDISLQGNPLYSLGYIMALKGHAAAPACSAFGGLQYAAAVTCRRRPAFTNCPP